MPNTRRNNNHLWTLGLLTGLGIVVLLTGCGRHRAAEEATAPAGQVIAHVGDQAVTAQELENELRLANVPLDKRIDPIRKRALTEILVRKYLAQQAVAAKLDREPTVLLDIMRSREQVLAGAQVQRTVASKAASIGKADIDQFIAAHPSQFSRRQILNIDQITLSMGLGSQAALDASKDFRTMEQVEQKLKELGILHSRSTGVLDSGNISDEFLAALEAKKADDIFFVRTGSNGTFFKVTSEQSVPLSGDDATNRARQLMRLAILKAESEQVSQAADASSKFEGEYVQIMGKQPAEKQPEKQDAPAKN
jgi:EpsD family peptidyl-prolyl cis-trans isomerase